MLFEFPNLNESFRMMRVMACHSLSLLAVISIANMVRRLKIRN